MIFGLDKDVQAWILENGWYDPIEGRRALAQRGRPGDRELTQAGAEGGLATESDGPA